MVACILGTTRSAFSIRSRHVSLRLLLDIPSNELAIATHAALQVHKVIRVADGADALEDLLALCAEALVLLASSFHVLLDLLQPRHPLWEATWTALCRRVVGVVKVFAHVREPLCRLGDDLGGSPLFEGHRS